MSLTVARAPFGGRPAALMNFTPPERFVMVEPLGRRLRATLAGMTVIDTDEAQLVHVTGALPVYAIPETAVQVEATPHPDVEGHVTVDWGAVDAWYEEDERVYVHPKDPYHRIDSFLTSRRVEVALAGQTLASSSRAVALYETGLPTRYYLPKADVGLDLLAPSPLMTECAYKGTARHWSTRSGRAEGTDVAWAYDVDQARGEGVPVAGRIAFYNERVDLTVDGRDLDRPVTPFSRDA